MLLKVGGISLCDAAEGTPQHGSPRMFLLTVGLYGTWSRY
jgi:hypothetical protein